MRSLAWTFTVFAFATCTACGGTEPGPGDASSSGDGSASADAADASIATCELSICGGKVEVAVGTTIQRGDSCGNTCSCKVAGGGLVSASCSLQPTDNCVCLDGGK